MSSGATGKGGDLGSEQVRLSRVRLSSEPDAPAGALEVLKQANIDNSIAVTGWHDYRPVAIFVRDAADAIRGGVSGWVWGRWLYVDELYLDAELRGHGWGSRLLAAAEDEARAAGAIGAYLETFSFQARPFYEAHGYRVVGEVSGFPPGEAYYILSKPL